jgi:hypothetical protein
MAKLFYDCLPDNIRPMKRYSSKKELVFENPNDKMRLVEPGLRSRIEVFPANKVTASRSGGYTYAHFSEVAFYQYPEELITSTVPSIPDKPGTVIIYESTGNGRHDFFHNTWLAAKAGDSNFVPYFFPWFRDSRYQTPLTEKQSLDLVSNLDDEEEMLIEKYAVGPNQLWWRRRKILDYQGVSNPVDKFHQEYPCNDVEGFLSSGSCYFNRTKLHSLLGKTAKPTFIGDITSLGLQANPEGPLSIWEKPEPDILYVMGVDSCEGVDGGDSAVIQVVKVPKPGIPLFVQCAEYVCVIDPVALAEKVVRIAQLYNDALVSIEINNHGLTTQNEVKQHYFNLYKWQYFDRFGAQISQKLGWETNMSTKPLLCDYTSACLNADLLVIRSESLIDEMFGFIRNQSGSGEAESGRNDDRIMAFMIGVFTTTRTYQNSSLLGALGKFDGVMDALATPPMPLSAPKIPWAVDDVLMEREYEHSWLNY